MVKLSKLLVIAVALGVVSLISFIYFLHMTSNDIQYVQAEPHVFKKEVLAPAKAVEGYCNPPDKIVIGAEGIPPTHYELVSVNVLVRHGNRLPMPDTVPLGPLHAPQVSCQVEVAESSIPQLITKYLKKTDVAGGSSFNWPYTLRPSADVCDVTHLTQIGVEQLIMVGQLLREAYQEKLYITQSHTRVVSTLRRRTYQSAAALAFGLFEDNVDFRSMDIEMINNTLMCKAEQPTLCECRRMDTYLGKAKRTLAKMAGDDEFFKEFTQSVQMAVKGTKYQLKSKYPWKSAFDLFSSWLCRGAAFPCQDGVCFTEHQADLIWQSLNSYNQALVTNSDMVTWAKLAMYPFLHDIMSRLSNHSRSTVITDVFSVYAGHDNTLVPLMLALELPVYQWPPLASRLVFELYKPLLDAFSDQYLFKLIYNGKDITKKLQFCVTNVGFSRSGCALKDFIHYVINILPNVGSTTYERACRL